MRVYLYKNSKQPEKKKSNDSRPYSVSELIECYYANAYHQSCINLKAICILGDGIEDPAADNKLKQCVRNDSVFTLLQKTILDLRIFGDAFWEIVQTGSGTEIYYLPSRTISLDKDGNWVQEAGKDKVTFAEDQIWHFYEPSLLSQVWGTPDYLPIVPTIKLFETITRYNANFFANNAIPDSIMFLKGGDITRQTEDDLRRFFRSKYQGLENVAKFCIAPLPQGVEVQLERLQETKEGKFLELKEDVKAEIVSCHGVPPRLAGILIPGQLGGGGEAEGELKIFLNTRVKPLQNIFGGQLDNFFKEVLGMNTDITFATFDIMPSSAETALSLLRG